MTNSIQCVHFINLYMYILQYVCQISGLKTDGSCSKYTSILFLKVFVVGDSTTSSGSEFQSLTIMIINLLRPNVVLLIGRLYFVVVSSGRTVGCYFFKGWICIGVNHTRQL